MSTNPRSTLFSQAMTSRVLDLYRKRPGQPAAAPKPADWRKPSQAEDLVGYLQAVANGWITKEEAKADHEARIARQARARAAYDTLAPKAARWSNPAPLENRQYAGAISTKPVRDARLTMGARACLTLIRALCGRGVIANTTKAYLAKELGRSLRTIQRYLRDLKDGGYLQAKPRTNRHGWHTGLTVRLMQAALPFFAEPTQLANWLHEKEPFYTKGETKMSPKNDSNKILTLFPEIGTDRTTRYA